MPLDSELQRIVRQALETADNSAPRIESPIEVSERLLTRVRVLHQKAEIGGEPDFTAIELACLALQLQPKSAARPSAKPPRITLRERTEHSAELLVSLLHGEAYVDLLDRTTRLLADTAQRQPQSAEARLLADAINLEDFGILGLISQFAQLIRHNQGPAHLVENAEKREQYGYWDARLKDSFHFDASRNLARKRLADARHTVNLLAAELHEAAK